MVATLSGPHCSSMLSVKMCLTALYICMSLTSAPRVDFQSLIDLVVCNAINRPMLINMQINAPFMVLEYETFVGHF